MKLKNMYVLVQKVQDFFVVMGYTGSLDPSYDTISLNGSIALFSHSPVLLESVYEADKLRREAAKQIIDHEMDLAVNAGCPNICFDPAYYLNFQIMTLKEFCNLLEVSLREMKKQSIAVGLHDDWAGIITVKE